MSDAPTPDAPAPASARNQRALWLRIGLSAVLAVAIVAALAPYLQTVPEDLHVAPLVIVGYVATLIPYHLLRAGRWVILLQPLAAHGRQPLAPDGRQPLAPDGRQPLAPDGRQPLAPAGRQPLAPAGEKLKIGVVTRISLAGYMWIALLPFRLGEFARPLFLAQKTSVSATPALGTIAIERVVDGLIVCAMFFGGVAGAAQGGELDALFFATTAAMGLFAAALAALIVAAVRPRWVGKAVDVTVGWALPGPARWASSLLVGMAKGLRALPSGRSAALFVLMSAAYWLTNAIGMWWLLDGCGLHVTLQQTIAILAVMNIALLVPGGPAQLGVFQTGVALGLALFVGADDVRGPGSTFAFYLYVCQLSTIVAFGIASQASLGLDWRALLQPRTDARTG